MSLLQRLDRMPPFVCRLLARKNRGRSPMSHLEIARGSGLAKATVAELSFKRTWAGVPVATVSRFSQACGVDLERPRRQIDFLKRRSKTYLLGTNGHARAMYGKLLVLLRDWASSKRDHGVSDGR